MPGGRGRCGGGDRVPGWSSRPGGRSAGGLEEGRPDRGQAEGTTEAYARDLAPFETWRVASGRAWSRPPGICTVRRAPSDQPDRAPGPGPRPPAKLQPGRPDAHRGALLLPLRGDYRAGPGPGPASAVGGRRYSLPSRGTQARRRRAALPGRASPPAAEGAQRLARGAHAGRSGRATAGRRALAGPILDRAAVRPASACRPEGQRYRPSSIGTQRGRGPEVRAPLPNRTCSFPNGPRPKCTSGRSSSADSSERSPGVIKSAEQRVVTSRWPVLAGGRDPDLQEAEELIHPLRGRRRQLRKANRRLRDGRR